MPKGSPPGRPFKKGDIPATKGKHQVRGYYPGTRKQREKAPPPPPPTEGQIMDSIVQKLKVADSPLAVAFSSLDGGWRNYIRYVIQAAKEGDTEMQRFMNALNGLSARERLTVSPEDVCDMAGVSVEDLIGAVLPLIWRYSRLRSSIVAATHDPVVLRTTAAYAMRPDNQHDREIFLKATGTLPIPKGSVTAIFNSAGSGPPPPTPELKIAVTLPFGIGNVPVAFKKISRS